MLNTHHSNAQTHRQSSPNPKPLNTNAQFSDACVRWAGAMGGLERLVQLHDRGVFQLPPGGGGGGGDDAGGDGAAGIDCPDAPNGGKGGGGGSDKDVNGGGGAGARKDAAAAAAGDVEAPQPDGELAASGDAGGDAGGGGANGRALTYSALSPAGRWLPTGLYARLKRAAPPRAVSAGSGSGSGGGGGDSALIDPSRFLGGVALDGAALSLRDRVQSVLMRGLSLRALPGDALVLEGARGAGKSLVLQLLLLQLLPPRGRVLLQVAEGDGAPPADGGDAAAVNGGGGAGSTGAKASKTAWRWRAVDFLADDVGALRRRMALVGAATAGVFRASVEDNIACAAAAAGADVPQSAVREAAAAAGLHGVIMALPEAYRTVVGDGTGIAFPEHVALRLSLARALVRLGRAPGLLLVDDAERAADALPGGAEALCAALAGAAARGAAVVAAARDGAGAALAEGLRAAGVANVSVMRVEGGTLVPSDAGGGGGGD